MAGMIVVPEHMPIGAAIEELISLLEARPDLDTALGAAIDRLLGDAEGAEHESARPLFSC